MKVQKLEPASTYTPNTVDYNIRIASSGLASYQGSQWLEPGYEARSGHGWGSLEWHTYLCIRGYDIQGRDLKMKLSTLGKLPNACAKTNEVLSCHIGGSSHQSLTASDIGNDNSVIQIFGADLIGASLSEPHTSMTALRTRVSIRPTVYPSIYGLTTYRKF